MKFGVVGVKIYLLLNFHFPYYYFFEFRDMPKNNMKHVPLPKVSSLPRVSSFSRVSQRKSISERRSMLKIFQRNFSSVILDHKSFISDFMQIHSDEIHSLNINLLSLAEEVSLCKRIVITNLLLSHIPHPNLEIFREKLNLILSYHLIYESHYKFYPYKDIQILIHNFNFFIDFSEKIIILILGNQKIQEKISFSRKKIYNIPFLYLFHFEKDFTSMEEENPFQNENHSMRQFWNFIYWHMYKKIKIIEKKFITKIEKENPDPYNQIRKEEEFASRWIIYRKKRRSNKRKKKFSFSLIMDEKLKLKIINKFMIFFILCLSKLQMKINNDNHFISDFMKIYNFHGKEHKILNPLLLHLRTLIWEEMVSHLKVKKYKSHVRMKNYKNINRFLNKKHSFIFQLQEETQTFLFQIKDDNTLMTDIIQKEFLNKENFFIPSKMKGVQKKNKKPVSKLIKKEPVVAPRMKKEKYFIPHQRKRFDKKSVYQIQKRHFSTEKSPTNPPTEDDDYDEIRDERVYIPIEEEHRHYFPKKNYTNPPKKSNTPPPPPPPPSNEDDDYDEFRDERIYIPLDNLIDEREKKFKNSFKSVPKENLIVEVEKKNKAFQKELIDIIRYIVDAKLKYKIDFKIQKEVDNLKKEVNNLKKDIQESRDTILINKLKESILQKDEMITHLQNEVILLKTHIENLKKSELEKTKILSNLQAYIQFFQRESLIDMQFFETNNYEIPYLEETTDEENNREEFHENHFEEIEDIHQNDFHERDQSYIEEDKIQEENQNEVSMKNIEKFLFKASALLDKEKTETSENKFYEFPQENNNNEFPPKNQENHEIFNDDNENHDIYKENQENKNEILQENPHHEISKNNNENPYKEIPTENYEISTENHEILTENPEIPYENHEILNENHEIPKEDKEDHHEIPKEKQDNPKEEKDHHEISKENQDMANDKQENHDITTENKNEILRENNNNEILQENNNNEIVKDNKNYEKD